MRRNHGLLFSRATGAVRSAPLAGVKWALGPAVVLATSMVFSFGASAQPAPTAADAGARVSAPADAGRAGDAAAPPVVADAGAPPPLADAGAAPPLADAGAARIPQVRKHAVLPPPTPQQVAAYEALRHEADVFEQGARDYKDTITQIITLHYEEKKKNILAGLDREIGVEKAELKKARELAIKRLEEFIQKYSGARAHPEATPDAMYRLAALYEEVARAVDVPPGGDAIGILARELVPAIRLYKRVIREFPQYRELAGIYYFLGHALNDSNRKDESQQVWRSLVCHNHYAYPVAQDAKDPDKDTISPLPQDNTKEFWSQWRMRYPTVASLKKAGADTKFEDPYPQDCAWVAQPSLRPGEEPKYLAEIWWQIGEWEFDNLDLGGGVLGDYPAAVWDYNRAASAYQHAMQFKKPPLYGVALYKYAWTLYKQERFEAAVKEFLHLLTYTDEQQKLTGDPGADFRGEAFAYIAASLPQVDFAGPSAEDPYIAREDIVVTEQRPGVAEQRLRVGIDRVRDPKVIPQDAAWTIEIYRSLAGEYRALNHYRSALDVYQLMLERWPMDPTAPETQNAIAEVYELLARQTKVGPERERYEAEILKARTALAKYVDDRPGGWVDHNKDNPAALQKAEELVRSGLKTAAIRHRQKGEAAVDEAGSTSDPARQVQLLETALAEYKLAAIGWQGYLKQDENAPDAYQTRYLYAESLHEQIRIEVLLNKVDSKRYPEPTDAEVDAAKQASVDVRDSDEDDKFLDNAAFFVVDLADVKRDLAYTRNQQGRGGIPQRTDPRLEGPDGDKKVVVEPLPAEIVGSMQARDEFVQRVPVNVDKQGRAPKYIFYVAEQHYAYGHFKEATERFEAIYKERCGKGKDELGYEAWKRLITMSNIQKDTVRSRQLAEAEKANSCAKTDAQSADAKIIVDPTIQEAAYLDARAKFNEAMAESKKPNPDKAKLEKLWREAAGMYEAALRAAPGRDEAPEAAINAAFAYKQVREVSKAIELYNLFIDKYGSEENLNRLQKGDPKGKVGPQLDKYKERVDNLYKANEALASTYYTFFNYPKAADGYAKIAANERFEDDKRVAAARTAMALYTSLGDRNGMNAQYNLLNRLKALTPEKRAEADFSRADFEYGQWNPTAPDTGNNATARRSAVAALSAYYNANKANPAAARFALEAAYKVGKMMKTVGDTGYRTWFRTTTTAWDYFAKNPFESTGPQGKVVVRATDPPYDGFGAEADYTLVDEEIAADFDPKFKGDPKNLRYKGTVVEVKKQYDADFELVEKKYQPKLDEIIRKYQSKEWTPGAMARTGTLYDKLRTEFELVVPVYFDAKAQALLDKLRQLGKDEDADKIEDEVRDRWRKIKDEYLERSTRRMISRYTQSAIFARKNNVRNEAVRHAIARLAFFTDYLKDDVMKKYVEEVPDPTDPEPDITKRRKVQYTPGMFLQWRAGINGRPTPNGTPAPLPLAP